MFKSSDGKYMFKKIQQSHKFLLPASAAFPDRASMARVVAPAPHSIQTKSCSVKGSWRLVPSYRDVTFPLGPLSCPCHSHGHPGVGKQLQHHPAKDPNIKSCHQQRRDPHRDATTTLSGHAMSHCVPALITQRRKMSWVLGNREKFI